MSKSKKGFDSDDSKALPTKGREQYRMLTVLCPNCGEYMGEERLSSAHKFQCTDCEKEEFNDTD